MKSDILTKFRYKKKMWVSPRHPLYFEPLEFKIIYATGVFIHAGLNKTINTLNNFELVRLLTKGLGLSNKEIAKVIHLAREETRFIDELLKVLKTPLSKHLFILDLASVSMRSTPISQEENQSVHVFTELLEIDSKKEKLLMEFALHAFAADSKNCILLYEKMCQLHMGLSMHELKYYITELDYVTKLYDKQVDQGAYLQLVDQCEVRGNLIVPLGATLSITNAVVRVYGNIVIDGGTLLVKDSILIQKSKDRKESKSIILVKNYSEIIIERSEIDCRNNGTAILQKNGNLTIKSSKIIRSSEGAAIKYWGDKINIESTNFEDCYTIENGAALLIQNGSGWIKDCKFYDCEAKNGGAIYTSDCIMIIGCKFRFCKAVEHGSAIYYNGAVKSNVTDCTYSNCFPDKEELIQYLGGGERRIQKECLINVTTILDCTLVVEELAVLEIQHTKIYVKKTIQCLGILNMKYSVLKAFDLDGRDLINVSGARGCNISYCEFDGAGTCGIMKAKGARINMSHCIITNTYGGRAIFDPISPTIIDCIFSYCLDGAIYTQGGIIDQCKMINCRAKSGAGILMYGSKGEITNSRFIRCISDYSGGAIDMSGTSYINGCEYEECKPNNVS